MKMFIDESNQIIEEQIQRSVSVLCEKGAEYATEDRLHNFRVAAELQQVSMRQSIAGMMCKHTVSIYDMCQSKATFSIEKWDEKITDNINYLLLLRCAIAEEMKGVCKNGKYETTSI